jgi:peroxiredoxin Q/BCP
MISIGKKIPHFTLKNDDGNEVNEDNFLGWWTVLYFYPKDDTPGCTTEACSLRDSWGDFQKLDVQIYGVSKDSVASHQKFREKFNLPFSLLADTEHQLAEEFGVWVEKTNYGRKYMGMQRATFIINPKGILMASFPKVDPTNHGPEILAKLNTLMQNKQV